MATPALCKESDGQLQLLRKGVLLIFLLFIFACSASDRLETALERSGQNRVELEKVLAHYSEKEVDSLKLRAAKFLIENMPGHYNLYGDTVASYIEQFDRMNPNAYWYARSYYYSLPLEENEVALYLAPKYDIEHISAPFLIKNIDFKFRLLEVIPWRDQLSFDDFCEYLLPYRFGNEVVATIPQIELDDIIARMTEFQVTADENTTMTEAREYLQEKIFAGENKTNFVKTPGNIPYNVRDCNAAALIYAQKNRLLGIPVVIDMLPHWGNASGRHTWNKTMDSYDKTILENYILRSKIAKVYRKTYSHNRAPREDVNFVPPLFTPFIKDVTSEYVQTADVEVACKNVLSKGVKNLYLAVFNEQRWQSVAWSEWDGSGVACFKNMGREIVYLPLCFQEGAEICVDYPFLLSSNGEIRKLVPQTDRLKTLHLMRKSHKEVYKLKWEDNMIGAVWEASNDRDFKSSDTIFILTQRAIHSTYDLKIDDEKRYRYFKLSQSRNKGVMCLSKLSFRDGEGRLVKGTGIDPMATAADLMNRQVPPSHISLNDLLTNENNHLYASLYGGLIVDFGTPVQIAYLRMLVRNDGNDLYPGNDYELLYRGKEDWVSLGVKKATDYFIAYDNVPSGALYWLRNLTEGKEERIFTYENGRMKFW